jgi:hypothetical protein
MDEIPYHTTARLKSLKAAADEWVKATGIAWDIAACWHLPICDMAGDVEHVEMAVGRKLRRYFNQLDRRIFKADHKLGFRVKRFITLEHAKSVGWHVHGFLATPEHMSQKQLIEDVKQVWLDCVQYDKIGLPLSRLTWCEPITSHYPQYTTKHSFGPLQNAKGAMDIQNTYFGELPN